MFVGSVWCLWVVMHTSKHCLYTLFVDFAYYNKAVKCSITKIHDIHIHLREISQNNQLDPYQLYVVYNYTNQSPHSCIYL